MKNIITLTSESDPTKQECWGSLTGLCKAHGQFKYRAINTKKYPFYYQGYLFNKVKYNESTQHQ